MTPGRRSLRYESFDEVMPDVERLLEDHVTVGNWSQAQICRHLAAGRALQARRSARLDDVRPVPAGLRRAEAADARIRRPAPWDHPTAWGHTRCQEPLFDIQTC